VVDLRSAGEVVRALVATLALLAAAAASAQMPPAPPPALPRGLVASEPGVSPGYVLFSPILTGTIYLLDNRGRVVHTWESELTGGPLHLLPNGHLLRGARDPDLLDFRFGGVSGIVQELDWDGNLVWEWRLGDAKRVLHHDFEPLPDGNLLLLAWELKTPEEAIAAGRRPFAVPALGLLSEWVLELAPQRPRGGRIVWEWHVWDHLVQHHDPAKPHYGDPAQYPGRLDVNVGAGAEAIDPEEFEQLKALGYVPADAQQAELEADFLHANSITHHPQLDQIAISVPETGEVWVIDHGIDTRAAAGPAGDLLYRWGNPAAYGRDDGRGRRLFFQHDARWIPPGFARAGNLTLFNNGRGRPVGPFSSVDEIEPPLRPDGRYERAPGEPFGPPELAWTAPLPPDRFAPFISGAERLKGGNTFVCAGTDGILLELSPEGRILWEYRNPYSGDARLADGSPVGPGISGRPYAVFRATRIPPDHPGLRGRELAPLEPQPATWEAARAAD
jgi:hypothetical protein